MEEGKRKLEKEKTRWDSLYVRNIQFEEDKMVNITFMMHEDPPWRKRFVLSTMDFYKALLQYHA